MSAAKPVFKPTLIALDIETTDISPQRGEIIEIAAIKYRQGRRTKVWHSLCRPRKKIPPIVKAITGLKDEDVADAPHFAEIKNELAAFLNDFPLVGHNIDFDIGFLRQAGIELKANPIYDTWKLATIVYQGARSFSLEALTARLDLEHKEKHRAEHDAAAGMRLFFHLVEKLQQLDPKVLEEISRLVTRTSWPLRDVFAEVVRMGPVATVSSPQMNVELTTAPAIPAAAAPTIAFSRPQLENLFAPDGVMNHRLPGYEYRPAQVEMMRYITEAFLKDQFLLVEAPPGVGKSMAYLLPAVMFAKARREKVVVSTYTLSLQNQLLEKDIPQLRAILSVPFEAVTLKGRQQYICRRLVDFFKRRANLSDDEVTTLVKLLIWLQETKTGEIGELALTREDRPILRRLVSDYHTCADKKCEVYRDCFIKAARRRAKAADIIIVNHALLLREPKFETEPVLLTKRLIIDEAHELETAATDAYGQSLTREMFDQWQRSLIYPKKKGGLLDFFPFRRQAEYLAALNHLKQITRQLGEDVVLFWGLVGIFAKRYQEASAYQRYEVSLTEILREQREWKQVNAAAEKLLAKIHQLLALLTEVADCLDDRKRPMQSAGEKEWLWEARSTIREGEQLARLVTEMFLSPRAEQIYWITVHREIDFVVRAAPRRVSEVLRTDLYAGKKSLVMTSATLSTLRRDESGEVNPSFDYFRDRLGLEGFRFERVADVFDYKKQALIYLPLDMVEPQSAKYASCLSKVIVQTALALGGRTLVLFTSYGGIKSAYEQVAEPLKKARIDVFAQGVTGGKMKLLQQFRSAPRGVLLGTATFWQGVDLPGEKLSCLIMAKLPFDVPTEPVFKARRAEYDDGFIDYAVPLAILRFRQGFGRLIRTKTDRGVMIIMDNRVEKSNFGLMFLRSLPECEVKYGLLADAAEMTKNWLANPKNKS